ncbi:HNH endonuclease [Sinorhizobium meliloti]|uniref:HNH endonuclease n=1 Tax=Rhizobium meliloti TaxID=382 RepID=UPI0012FE4BB6|nr:HNH endonuclease [Sinorhizobium meliloti]
MADHGISFVIARNKDGKPKRGEALRWLDEIAVPFSSKCDCLLFPFYRAKSGHGRLSGRNGPAMAHVYVAEAVIGERPPGLECRHLCGNGDLGCVNPHHLAWGTRSENMADRKTHGVAAAPPIHLGRDNKNVKLNEDQVREIRCMLASGFTLIEIGDSYGIRASTVSLIKNRKTWAWLD